MKKISVLIVSIFVGICLTSPVFATAPNNLITDISAKEIVTPGNSFNQPLILAGGGGMGRGRDDDGDGDGNVGGFGQGQGGDNGDGDGDNDNDRDQGDRDD